MRIAVVTSKTAERMIREIVGRSRSYTSGQVEVDIVTLPVPAIGMLSAKGLARLLEREKERLTRSDLVLVPGSISGSVEPLSEVLGVRVVKASRDAGLLPLLIDYLAGGGDLSPDKPAEEYLRVEPGKVKTRTAYRLEGLEVPVRGPPVVIVAEIPPEPPRDPVEMALDYVAEGARLIVVGAMPGRTGGLESLIKKITAAVDVPVVSEAPTPGDAKRAVEAGAVGVSVSASMAGALAGMLPKDSFVLLGERDPEELVRAVEELSRAGYSRLAVDPVVGVPMVDLADTAFRYKAVEGLGVPIWFSAANAANSIDSDTHGVYAILAVLAVELGASFFLVVEDDYKTRHSVAEAREALALAEAAWARGRPPGGIGSRLFVVKQPVKPPPPALDPEGAEAVLERIEPLLEPGHFVIEVDHDRRLIIVEYRRGRIRKKWAGRKARYLARRIARSVELGAEHAAYLGEELYKAELALRFGLTYIQDRDPIVPVWEDGDEGC